MGLLRLDFAEPSVFPSEMYVPIQEPRLRVEREHRTALISYAEDMDLSFLDEWKTALGSNGNPLRVDAVNIAKLAVRRFKTHRKIENYVSSFKEMSVYTQNNSQAEVAHFVLLKAPWYRPSSVLGICHF